MRLQTDVSSVRVQKFTVKLHNSVIGADVTIEKAAVSVIPLSCAILPSAEGVQMDKAIIAENVHWKQCCMGCGEEAPNVLKPAVYAFGLATVGEKRDSG